MSVRPPKRILKFERGLAGVRPGPWSHQSPRALSLGSYLGVPTSGLPKRAHKAGSLHVFGGVQVDTWKLGDLASRFLKGASWVCLIWGRFRGY